VNVFFCFLFYLSENINCSPLVIKLHKCIYENINKKRLLAVIFRGLEMMFPVVSRSNVELFGFNIKTILTMSSVQDWITRNTRLSLETIQLATLLMTWSRLATTPSTWWPTCRWEPVVCRTTCSSTRSRMVRLTLSEGHRQYKLQTVKTEACHIQRGRWTDNEPTDLMDL